MKTAVLSHSKHAVYIDLFKGGGGGEEVGLMRILTVSYENKNTYFGMTR